MSKGGLGVLFCPAIAVGVEQDLPGGEDRAFAVVLQRTTLKHEAEPPDWRASEPSDVVADSVVARKVELAAPAVEVESERNGAFSRARKDGACIAKPDISISRRQDLCGAAKAHAGGCFGLSAVHQQPHPVLRSKRAHQRRHITARHFQVSDPLL